MTICNNCGKEKPQMKFPKIEGGYRKTCKQCYAGEQKTRELRKVHRQFNALVRWPAVVLTIVTAIYSHDLIDGRNRICFYESIYGSHAVTIDAMNMCPLTWEFEV